MSRTGTCQYEQEGSLGLLTADEPARVTTTLYDVITALQTVAEPDVDDLVVVSVVMRWLRSGRLTTAFSYAGGTGVGVEPSGKPLAWR
jgi:hypothetical protein